MSESPARRSSFAGDVLKLASGATIAQVIGVALSPVLARLFSPEAFGTAGVFTSILSVLGLMACLRYELAILLPESDEDAAHLLVGSLLAVGAMTALSALGMALLGRSLGQTWLKAPDVVPYLWLIPVAVLAEGCYLALRHWGTRTKRFGRLSTMRVAASLGANAMRLGAGWLRQGSAGALIGATVVGNALPALGLGWHTWREHRALLSRVRCRRVAALLKRYSRFPLVSSWSAMLSAVSAQTPVLFLSGLFSQTIVGYYSFGMRMVQLPMTLVGSAIGQVLFQRAAEAAAVADGSLGPLVERTYQRMVMVGALPLLLLALVGPEFFGLVFGAQWIEAGAYSSILAAPLFFTFVIGSMPLFSVTERQVEGLAFMALLFVARVLPFAWGAWRQAEPRSILLVFSVLNSLVWLALSLWQFRAVQLPMGRAIYHLGRALLWAIPTGIIVSLAKWGLRLPPLWLLLVTLVACAPYIGVVLRQDALFHNLAARFSTLLPARRTER